MFQDFGVPELMVALSCFNLGLWLLVPRQQAKRTVRVFGSSKRSSYSDSRKDVRRREMRMSRSWIEYVVIIWSLLALVVFSWVLTRHPGLVWLWSVITAAGLLVLYALDVKYARKDRVDLVRALRRH